MVFPPHTRRAPAHDYLQPILDDYSIGAYAGMEHAIFPSFFHGKCQNAKTGVNPPGCPNPDCPVVCGTPGSLVHFFPTLREIAYNRTRNVLIELASPGSDAYAQVEKLVLSDALRHEPRSLRMHMLPDRHYPPNTSRLSSRVLPAATREGIQANLQTVLSNVAPLLGRACGMDGDTEPHVSSLSKCSWEKKMKEYILTFP